jgi:hypothetical protein
MRIGLEGFGSIWSVRTKPNVGRAAYYNTTGLVIDGKLRHRSRIFGDVRFNEIGDFNSKQIERNIGRVFESGNPAECPQQTLLLHHLSNLSALPDCFLFAVSSDRTGELSIDCDGWKSDAVTLISLSQANGRQEALLLMPAHSWIRGTLGHFVVEHRTDRPWRACLQLKG